VLSPIRMPSPPRLLLQRRLLHSSAAFQRAGLGGAGRTRLVSRFGLSFCQVRHREGDAVCPSAVDGSAGHVLNASGMQRGEKSPPRHPPSTLHDSSQALRSFGYAAENPAMLRMMGPCGSLSLSGSKPEISMASLSSTESITLGQSVVERISI